VFAGRDSQTANVIGQRVREMYRDEPAQMSEAVSTRSHHVGESDGAAGRRGGVWRQNVTVAARSVERH
jgi:hypothetical protein